MAEYKDNKVQRRPFPEGTVVDVILRGHITTFGGPHLQLIKHNSNVPEDATEVIGTVVGEPLTDWKIDGSIGDILAYRKHEAKSDE